MKVEALALVDIVTGKKQEMAWICAFNETDREPGNALGKPAFGWIWHASSNQKKRGLGTGVFARKENCFIERKVNFQISFRKFEINKWNQTKKKT